MENSKLFSGDLPEMTIHIIKYLGNDMSSLHSCILVNRFWCRIAIPILWKDPFSTIFQKEFDYHLHFLDIYFLLLSDDDKKRFRSYKVGHRMNSYSFKPLFNYLSFIKTLNTYQLEFHVVNWLKFIQEPSHAQSYSLFIKNYDFYNESLMVQKNKRSSLSIRYYKMTKTLCTLLCKLFIDNNASLNNLSINIPPDSKDHFFVEIYDSILKKPNFILNIENFILKSISPNLQPFLSSILSLIKNLNFYLSVGTILTKNLENIIQSQAHLSSLTISITASDIVNIDYLFYAFKHCSGTLTSIRFSGCNFSNISLPIKPLKYLTQLKSLHFIKCSGLKLHTFQPLLDISTPLKIKSLSLHCLDTEVALIQPLIQKIGAYLENLLLNFSRFPTEALDCIINNCIINNCINIKFLHLYNIGDNISNAIQLISHFKDNIEYLTIDNYYASSTLKELGQNLPVNLKYLHLNIPILTNNLQIFLENCKNIELKKLLIQSRLFRNDYDNLQILKTFVQEKNLEYLAFVTTESLIHNRSKEFQKEFQSFVKIMRYEYLVIDITDFD